MKKDRIYVGSYTQKGADRLGAGPGIVVCEFDRESQKLEILSVNTECQDPSFLKVKGDIVYAAEELPQSRVSLFEIDGKQLNKMETIGLDKKDTCHLSMTSEGDYLFTANYGSGSLSMISLTDDGWMEAVKNTQKEEGSSVHPRQSVSRVHSTLLSPDGKTVYTANLGADTLTSYRIDPEEGALIREKVVSVPPGRGPRHMAFSPDSHNLFVVCELSSSLLMYSYDEISGIGSLKAEYAMASETDIAEKSALAADLHFSPDGKFLYVSVRGTNRIWVFSYTEEGIGEPFDFDSFGSGPRSFCLTEDGRYLVIANEISGNVAVVERDADTGALKECVSEVKIPRAVSVSVL